MTSPRTTSVFHKLHVTTFAPLIVAAIACGEARTAVAVNISIAGPEIIYTKSQRGKAGGSNWPDGSLGVVSNGNGTYDFYGPNGKKRVKSVGTLANPGASKQSVDISGVPKGFDYLSGGPIFQDTYSGARLMVYHAEERDSLKNFHASIGLAISTDPEHLEFQDLGLIIRPNKPEGIAEVGGGSFAIIDGYFNVYYTDWLTDGSLASVAVARAPVVELLTNALAGRQTAFTKYYNGSWSEPGLEGKASPLEVGNPPNSWVSVSYNEYLGQAMLVSSQWSADNGDLYFATSPDGVNWSPRQPLAVDPGEQFYPTIIGTGPDPTRTGQSFYVYYTDSKKGVWSRWKDAELRRREVTITSPGANPGEVNNSLGYSAEWVTVGDYQDDFQAGGPAQGWTYAWDPKGKVGKSADYAPLVWSDVAQAYNTTGGATMVPNPKAHKDDYLSLTTDGGHPGDKKYMPMAGYTIQVDDGEGFYRLFGTSIQKSNGSLTSKEDGLGVLVYVNDTLIGTEQNVATNGLWTSFDRTLGSLNVGDTVWVMIDPLKTQIDDQFFNFDFTLQKLVYSAESFVNNARFANAFAATATVPEPSAGVLLLLSMMAIPRRGRRGRLACGK